MGIEEVIKIYDFLGNLDIPGFLALCILLLISVFTILQPLSIQGKTRTRLLVLIFISLIVLYYQANNKIEELHRANFIKQDLIASSFKQRSFVNIHLPEKVKDTTKLLTKLIDKFPDEFLLVNMNVVKDTIELINGKCVKKKVPDKNPSHYNAIALIDKIAVAKIDSQINSRATRTARLLSAILEIRDTIYVDTLKNGTISPFSLKKIDNTAWMIGQEFFKALVGKNNLQPVYDTSNWDIIGFTTPKKIPNDDRLNAIAKYIVAYMQAHSIDKLDNDYDKKKPLAPSLQILSDNDWLMGQPFFGSLVGRSGLQPIYDYKWNIIGFSILKKK